jgi:putative spermidine/putrescine transport system substrate-binding protein
MKKLKGMNALKRSKAWIGWICIVVFSIMLAGCSQNKSTESVQSLLDDKWEKLTEQAKGQTVNLYMWGGSDSINKYIDEWVGPRLKKQADVTLKRVPMNDTKDIINKLITEKQASKQQGTIDIMWINGENFKTSKESDLLFGSFASKLPNAKEYVDLDSPDIANDFGLPTEGMEAPWGKAQFVFVYDEAKMKNPPKSMKELKQWVEKNPGKFTYPAQPDFTGSAFVRHAMYETTGGHEQYLNKLDQTQLESRLNPLWNYLNEIERHLWREGKTYPESLAKLDQLFANGEVWMSMGYDPARASNLIEKGTYPKTVRTFVLDGGTLSNTHYLAIPFNAPNPAGAMATINYLLSPEAQIAKYDPIHWGEDMAIDPAKLSDEDYQKLEAIDRGSATLPADVLASHRLPEILSSYVSIIEKGWTEHVAKK